MNVLIVEYAARVSIDAIVSDNDVKDSEDKKKWLLINKKFSIMA